MTNNEIELFRNLLNQRMQELRSEAGKTVEDMDEDENFPDPADRASMESNRNSVLRIRDRERKLIFKIQEALQRRLQARLSLTAARAALAPAPRGRDPGAR